MTFLTKPNYVVKKNNLLEGKGHEEVIEVQAEGGWGAQPRPSAGELSCVTLLVLAVTLLGVGTGFVLYRHYTRPLPLHRYHGFCTIPVSTREGAAYEPQYRVMPLTFSPIEDMAQAAAELEDRSDRELQAAGELQTGDELLQQLHEQLEIEDAVEKISVFDNGRHVNFIHDFNANVTGIVDSERCFETALEPATTLAPEAFVLRIAGGGAFDVSRARASLRALLPALARLQLASPELARRCVGKPVYRLVRDGDGVVRKRSVDAPAHDYIQFAGRRVLEIEINNLAELLQRERPLGTAGGD